MSAAMRSCAGARRTRSEDRLHFEFSLGKALEDEGAYQESFAHYAAGNATPHARTPVQRR